jgi:hypothetical protein
LFVEKFHAFFYFTIWELGWRVSWFIEAHSLSCVVRNSLSYFSALSVCFMDLS